MNHQIKINRAIAILAGRREHVGPVTVKAVLSSFPASLFDQLTAAQLADVYQVATRAHRAGRGHETRAILAEGAIWDGSKLREVA